MRHKWTPSLAILLCFCFLSNLANAELNKAPDNTENSEKIERGKFYGAKNASHPDWFKESFLDFEEDVADATASNKRLVLYFWQPGCPYCDQLWRDNFAEQGVVKQFRKHFDIVALNMWGDREIISVAGKDYSEKSFAAALGIQYTPTLLFFDENKKVIHRLNGYVPSQNFQLSIDYVIGKHEKKQTFSEYSILRTQEQSQNISSQPQHTNLHSEDFFIQPSYDLNTIQKGKHLAVYFESKHCKNCDLLHTKTLQDKTTRDLAKQFISVQLDRFSTTTVITPQRNRTTAEKWATDLDIEYLPAIIFFNEQGKEIMRIDTQLRTFHVQSIFDYVLSDAYKIEKNFQRYISDRADRVRETGKDVDIFTY